MTYALYPPIAPRFLEGNAKEEPLCPPITDPDVKDVIPTEYSVDVDGDIFEVKIMPTGFVDIGEGDSDEPADYEEGTVLSTMQGMVIKLAVEVGDKVTKGSTICVIEAMKMENNIEAEYDGVVTDILIEPGDAVSNGTGLMVIKEE